MATSYAEVKHVNTSTEPRTTETVFAQSYGPTPQPVAPAPAPAPINFTTNYIINGAGNSPNNVNLADVIKMCTEIFKPIVKNTTVDQFADLETMANDFFSNMFDSKKKTN